MSWFVTFITSKIAGPLFGAASVLLAVALLYTWTTSRATEAVLNGQLKAASAQLDQSRKDLDQCQANRATLQADLTSQNAAVSKLRADGEAATAKADAALANARAAGAETSGRAAAILAAKSPSNDLCAAAAAVLTPGSIK